MARPNRSTGFFDQERVGEYICSVHNHDADPIAILELLAAVYVTSSVGNGRTEGPHVEGKRAIAACLRVLDLAHGV